MIDTVTVKNWPTCGQMHSALDCAAELASGAAYAPGDIARVLVEAPQACSDIAGIRAPRTVSEAKFSTSFCVAAMLNGKRPDFRGLDPALLEDVSIRKTADRVELRADPAFSARFPRERPARVTVTLNDGTRLSAERAFRKGDPEAPWTRAELLERTRDVLGLAGRAVDADALFDWCDRFAAPDCADWSAGELFSFTERRPTRGVEGAA